MEAIDLVLATIGGIFFIIFGIFMSLYLVLVFVCNWRIFSKAGEPGWKALIPFYNTIVQYSFTWKTLWGVVMIVLLLVGSIAAEVFAPLGILSLGGLVISCIGCHKLSVSFGHGVGFTLGLIFLSVIFLPILAFGNSEYIGRP